VGTAALGRPCRAQLGGRQQAQPRRPQQMPWKLAPASGRGARGFPPAALSLGVLAWLDISDLRALGCGPTSEQQHNPKVRSMTKTVCALRATWTWANSKELIAGFVFLMAGFVVAALAPVTASAAENYKVTIERDVRQDAGWDHAARGYLPA